MSSNLNIIKAVSGDIKDKNVDISFRRSMHEGNACLTPIHTGVCSGRFMFDNSCSQSSARWERHLKTLDDKEVEAAKKANTMDSIKKQYTPPFLF
eukprot:4363172-Amphidinium_carterae.1